MYNAYFSALTSDNLPEPIDGAHRKICVDEYSYRLLHGDYYCSRGCCARVQLLLDSMELLIKREHTAKCRSSTQNFYNDNIRENGKELLPPDELARHADGHEFRVTIAGHTYYRQPTGVRYFGCGCCSGAYVRFDSEFKFYLLSGEHKDNKCEVRAEKKLVKLAASAAAAEYEIDDDNIEWATKKADDGEELKVDKTNQANIIALIWSGKRWRRTGKKFKCICLQAHIRLTLSATPNDKHQIAVFDNDKHTDNCGIRGLKQKYLKQA